MARLVTVSTAKDAAFVIKMSRMAGDPTFNSPYKDWHQHILASAQFARWLHHSTFSFVGYNSK